MRIAIISAALPPALDGIGDYSACLAAEIATGGHNIVLLTGNAAATQAYSIPDVRIRGAFDPACTRSAEQLLRALADETPDWAILQYNPFSYGRRGYNLHLPRALWRLRDVSPRTRLAVMFHETYVPAINWKFAVMATWQRRQFRQLGQAADVLFFSIRKWADDHRLWFPEKAIVHLPVGSNVPRIELPKAEARGRLGIAEDEVVLGVFGNAHVSRSFAAVANAARAVHEAGRRVRVVYAGADGAAVRAALGEATLAITDGPLPAGEVSRRLSSVDVALSTYIDGVSTRRGAMMTALQHGLTVAGTHGLNTDPELLAENERAFSLTPVGDDQAFANAVVRLASDAAERKRLGTAGQALYERCYAWPRVAEAMLSHL